MNTADNIYNSVQQQARTLRYFPDGRRNCYALRTPQGKGNTYLIRAWFYYGNYDKHNNTTVFHLHVGVNYWTTVQLAPSPPPRPWEEVIYFAVTDDIQVCLINTGGGTPFISVGG